MPSLEETLRIAGFSESRIPDLIHLLAKNGVNDAATLVKLTDDDLRACGITLVGEIASIRALKDTKRTYAHPTHFPVRVVTSTALFDGHDVSINIMRRILQEKGAEVIHLGHTRTVRDIAQAAIQEDVQAVAISSYQGGHMEFFTYLRKRLDEAGACHIKIFGGGGGVIVPDEIQTLHDAGITRIFSPEDGRTMGLEGMIDFIIKESDFSTVDAWAQHKGDAACFVPRAMKTVDALCPFDSLVPSNWQGLGRTITHAELGLLDSSLAQTIPRKEADRAPVIGLTGTGGAGKSSMLDEILRRFSLRFPEKWMGVLCVDPTRRRTGGALLGDRIRLNSVAAHHDGAPIYVRSLAARGHQGGISPATASAVEILQWAHFDLIFVETAGIGQSEAQEIRELCDCSIYVMTSEFGAPTQLEKIEMLDVGDFIVLNKADHFGAEDALDLVRKQVQRNRKQFTTPLDEMPVFPCVTSVFNNDGVNVLFSALVQHLGKMQQEGLAPQHNCWQMEGHTFNGKIAMCQRTSVLPAERSGRYLAEAADAVRAYHKRAKEQGEIAADIQALERVISQLDHPVDLCEETDKEGTQNQGPKQALETRLNAVRGTLSPASAQLQAAWNSLSERYKQPFFEYTVRDKTFSRPLTTESLAKLTIPRVALPVFQGAGDLLQWLYKENLPGYFPFTAGVFPLKRAEEEPTRMFAGEGGPAKTNKRFHLLAAGRAGKRLSTAFDAVSLYGEDPAEEPDVLGKVGESGVAISTIEDMEMLYGGFDLLAPDTSVSMTINGPAPPMLAMFFNTAFRQRIRKFLVAEGRLQLETPEACLQPDASDQRIEILTDLLTEKEHDQLWNETVQNVRGTVQADILKEDQGQNTCIFSTAFALKMMGDIQEYFIDHKVRNYYSVSISGYHLAEAGANPITQLAFTLANGLTYLEYYKSRGMNVDDVGPNFSFFFSNGMEPEYTVLGRVARRIWSVVLRDVYGASKRSQMLKYHIQTSGRSLHLQEINFNDIRTILQALLAVFDNTNSLHTNAYDESITTPTEESVRRALAIQLIVSKEFGLTKCENPLQGSFVIEALTDLVEEAVLCEFDRLSSRGGVLGAMELGYQRSRIQEESMDYEHKKHSGEYPIVGVNTFINPQKDMQGEIYGDLRRSTPEEKQAQLNRLRAFQGKYADKAKDALKKLQLVAEDPNGNVFAELVHTVNYASLGQIVDVLYAAGGQYRRNM